jgi:aminoglycoside phosphotransferase (APT) family kinase protein
MTVDRLQIEAYLGRLTGKQVRVDRLYDLGNQATGAAALKAFGYGRPLCIDYQVDGQDQRAVLRRVNRNGFGRERDSDRVAEVWLDYHAFNRLPAHVNARDMIGLTGNGQLESLGDIEDMLLLTDFAPGQTYAEDLLRIRDTGEFAEQDVRRARALAAYLADIHAVKHSDPLLWRRRLRDLVGHGEGIMGLTDSYPPDFALASADDWRAIENAANAWRWRLKPLAHRLSQVHGDFHPFNVLFTQDESFVVLDRSRGEWGEPADDISCMTINYLFFSLQHSRWLDGPFLKLYTTFWDAYLEHNPDDQVPRVIQPWFAWRALVLASPQWYPSLQEDIRGRLLTLARRVLAEDYFDWRDINRYLEA